MPGPEKQPYGCCVFATALGQCAIAWSERGVRSVQLPEDLPEETLERLLQRVAPARLRSPPPWLEDAIHLLQRHLAGVPQDLRGIPLDMEGIAPFSQEVYRLTRSVPPGETMTYGQLGLLAGSPRSARAVGQAMARNPLPLLVPCHRIVGAGRRLTGFSAAGGISLKARLLELERCRPFRQ